MILEVGMKRTEVETVTEENTAKAFGSGGLLVYATPAMVLLMEKTSFLLAEEAMEEGMTTVGTSLQIKHISASPIGSTITCQSELVEIDRKRLVFRVEVSDQVGKIGEGIHERFLVEGSTFVEKANSKLEA